MMSALRTLLLIGAALPGLALAAADTDVPDSGAGAAGVVGGDPGQWTGWGGNLFNNRWASRNRVISSSNIKSLTSRCKVSYPKGVSATPVLAGNVAYYPTWNGSFAALDWTTCRVLWQVNVSAIVEGFAPISEFQAQQTKALSRTSPQVDGDVVYLGTQTHALLVALDRATGRTLDVLQINPHPLAVLTMSPTFYGGKLFIGACSVEENVSLLPTYPCCSFVGNMVAVTLTASKKFRLLWNTTTIPESRRRAGWSGSPIWGSQPAVDAARGRIYIATGNVYSVPNATIQCQKATQPSGTQYITTDDPDPCLPADVWQDSVLALDMATGRPAWVHQSPSLDAYSAACGFPDLFPQNFTLCPEIPGVDADFAMAPTFVPGGPHGDILVAGRKNGVIYTFAASTGHLLWSTKLTPYGFAGGSSWGVAVDDSRVYFTAINSGEYNWTLFPSGRNISRSAYGAVRLSDGAKLWETAVPQNGVAYAPPTVVGDLMLVGRTGLDPNGTSLYDQTAGGFVALDKATGRVLMELPLETNFHGGIAVVGDHVFFGTGYWAFQPPSTVPGSFNVMAVKA